MTVGEVSEMLHINAETVRRWIRNGQLRAELVGKTYIISEEDLYIFAASHCKYAVSLGVKEDARIDYKEDVIFEKCRRLKREITILKSQIASMEKIIEDLMIFTEEV